MGLIDDIKTKDDDRSASYLLSNSKNLRAQEQQLKTDIASLKAQIKTDTGNDVFTSADLRALADKQDLLIQVTAKKPQIKTELQTMRALLKDANYKAELLAEENLL